MAKKNNKNQKELIMKIVVAVLVLVIIMIIISISYLLEDSQRTEKKETATATVTVTPETVQEEADRTEIEKLKGMNERNRIEYYITKFINYAENGEYEKAYALLNRDYRKTYFPTESSFRDYAQETFTKMLDVKYTNFERNGEIYVSWVTLTDGINGAPDSGKNFNFVVKESDFNDFELSFSKN